MGFWGCAGFPKTHTASMGFREDVPLKEEEAFVSFAGWSDALKAAHLPGPVGRDYRRDIWGLLRACKQAHRPVSAGFIRWFLERRGFVSGGAR
jgi:hypothetical protein